jgi:hypothetical protein
MTLPTLTGSPKQTSWATKIRSDRLKVWSDSSPQKFKEIENSLVTITDAGWWISYKDKDIITVFNHFSEGIDLNKIQRDEWEKNQKKKELKDSAGVRAYLKKELKKESNGKKIDGKQDDKLTMIGPSDDGLMKWEGPVIDSRTGEVSSDTDLPF